MKKYRVVSIIVLVVIVTALVCWRCAPKKDPYWEIAEEIYRVETALKEVDENWERQSITNITPYEITNPHGNSIYYTCCHTKYFTEAELDSTGLDTDVIGTVVDLPSAEQTEDCKVGDFPARIYSIGEQKYLCWTSSPEYSFVIEYTSGSVDEADIFKMAESVQLPGEDE